MADFARTAAQRPVLATNARIATGSTVCGVCGQRIAGGSREAQTPDGQWAHLWPCLLRRPA